MTFIDEVTAVFTSGRGGDGSASFHREKHVPRGGPNGADGGRGGDVVLVADRHLRTLYELQLNHTQKAGDGTQAHGNKAGTNGKSLTVAVPVGTVVYEEGEDEPLADLGLEGMTFTLCRGGRGGAGNVHYTNSVRQAPAFAQRGESGETATVRLELKLLADVGLIGLPNAGKSTLLGQISKAKPKIGAYPFTTITPNLGVAVVDHKSFVVADLPGLIEGASEGQGLGHRFLKHTERTKVLIHLVDAFPLDGTDPWKNYQLIEDELAKYSASLFERPRIIALNKADLQSLGDLPALIDNFAEAGRPVYVISGATGEGVEALLYKTLEMVEEQEKTGAASVAIPVQRLKAPDDTWTVEIEEGEFIVKGRKIERMVDMTQLENPEAVRHLHRRLERSGVIGRLREMGAEEGSTVVINNWEFTFREW